jgi:hypothetical protein
MYLYRWRSKSCGQTKDTGSAVLDRSGSYVDYEGGIVK